MPVVEPYIDAKLLLSKPGRSPKELLEERLLKRVTALNMDVINSEKQVILRKNAMDVFLSEIDSCVSEQDVKVLCGKYGL